MMDVNETTDNKFSFMMYVINKYAIGAFAVYLTFTYVKNKHFNEDLPSTHKELFTR